MAHASRKRMGPGTQGKGSGGGAGDPDAERAAEALVPDNKVLSNRDKAQHPHGRSLDSKQVQTEQLQDHAGNRVPRDEG